MNGNSEVSADPVTEDVIRAAIYAADRKARGNGRPGFTTLEVAGTLSKGTVGIRAQIWRQVHNTVRYMVREGAVDPVEDDFIVLPYYVLADGMAVTL